MPKDSFWAALFGVLPLNKLRRYETTNLIFEAIALYFTLRFTTHQSNPIGVFVLWVAVVLMGLVCVFWASKQ
jgi:hypothetical protein